MQDCYWPTGYDKPCTFDCGVTVSLIESEDEDGLTIREMKIDSVKVYGVCVLLVTWMCVLYHILYHKIYNHNIIYPQNKESAHTLKQFHLDSWPVSGAPTETTPTLEMIEQSRVHWRDTGFNLILVHTAAG